MAHHKRHHYEHGPATAVSPPENESSVGPFFRSLGVYLSRHWAWPAIIALWWLFRTRRNLSDTAFVAIMTTTVVVVIFGWRQLTGNSYWRGYFGILLLFAGLMVFIGAFPVLFILFFVTMIAVAIDLFFVAPHRGL